MVNRCPTLNGRRPSPTKSGVFGVIVPWCTRKIPTLPTKGSMTTLNTCASTCAFAPGTAKNSCASAPSPFRNGGALPSVAFGARSAKMSSSAAMPAPFLAEVKHTGMRCPSRSAFSKGACSCSGATSPCSRYFSISASSTSTTGSTSAACASLTEEKSASPSGLKKQSTTSFPPFEGRLIGRHSRPTVCWMRSSIDSRSAFSASMRLITIMRHRFRCAAHFNMRSVASWIPVSAFTTTTAVSTAARAPMAWPMKSGDPGVSIRWIWVFFQAKLTMAELSECLYSFSSGSKSQTVLPFSTLPAAGMAPALARSASARVVLPAPVWPTSATVRMDSVEYLGMRTSSPRLAPATCFSTLLYHRSGRRDERPWSYARRLFQRLVQPEVRRQRRMVRNAPPRASAVGLGALDLEAAHVDAVQAQHRKRAGEAARGPAPAVGERLAQIERHSQALAREVAPVVEIARDHQRRALGHLAVQPLDQRAHLLAPAALVEREVNADAMQRRGRAGNVDLAVQEAAALAPVERDVLVLGPADRVTAEDRVAVMAVRVDGVAPVGEVGPHLLREKFVLGLGRPVLEAHRVAAVLSLHLLQENDVGAERAQALAQLVDHQAAIKLRETLVDVVGRDVQFHAGSVPLFGPARYPDLSILSEKPRKKLGKKPFLD